nr:hypothetical protein [Kibdelosporangium sp. MJ126-NF4]CTQ99016.1 hypothetical protein [Kibdelosporangium sp. MJ126-NF4]
MVLVADHLNGGMKALAEELRNVGATVAAIVLNTRPTAGVAAAEHVWSCAEHGLEMTHSQFESWLCTPSAELLGWLDGMDPRREWTALGTTYAEARELGGRPFYGHWCAEWAVWEDKTRIDELWREAEVPSPPYAVTGAGDPGLPEVVARVDQGHGVVLAVDSSRGALGSSHGLCWVRNRQEFDAAVEGLRDRTDRVRVAAFMPGVPCSVLAMVLPDGVAVFDPFEILTLRDRMNGRFVYCGTSTWWRPDPRAREEIRRHVRAVGQKLAQDLAYTGMFSVDGVLGARGFLATELNPRHVSGLGLRAGWPEFPTRLLNRAVQTGVPGDLGCARADLEPTVRRTVRLVASCSVWVPVPGLGDEPETTVRVVSRGTEHAVRYRAEREGAWLLGADPLPGDGALGPLAAALAARLGSASLVSFATDAPRSSFVAVSG